MKPSFYKTKKTKLFSLRKAHWWDAIEIAHAHRRSIQELCSKDYSKIQINAWSNRHPNFSLRMKMIQSDPFWVVEVNKRVEGFAHMTLKENEKHAFLWGLYFTPKLAGKGAGKEILKKVEDCASQHDRQTIKLQSTLSSRAFYRKHGFKETSKPSAHPIRGIPVPCVCMEKTL